MSSSSPACCRPRTSGVTGPQANAYATAQASLGRCSASSPSSDGVEHPDYDRTSNAEGPSLTRDAASLGHRIARSKLSLTSVDAEAVYLRLPIPLQHAACSAVGWWTQRTRYADPFQQVLAATTARTYWSTDEVEAFRNRRLAEVVE